MTSAAASGEKIERRNGTHGDSPIQRLSPARSDSRPGETMTDRHFQALPSGFQLEEYRIQNVLGQGGFGITYLAWDTNLENEVALKEYLPSEFAVRQGELSVGPRSSDDEEDYFWGLERFLNEAQTVAKFRHPSIIPVYRFFEANGTAYMVMEYQKGENLANLLKERQGRFTEAELRALVMSILDGLAEVHKAGFLHRDIKPGNIFIRQDGSPVLLDFGAARDAIGRKSKSLTSIVTPGYAPLEQYFSDGNQGAWTDMYALGAILYQAVSGQIPPEAPARIKKDPMVLATEVGKGRYSEKFLSAIDKALLVAEEDRPQSVEQWRPMFDGGVPAGKGPREPRPPTPARRPGLMVAVAGAVFAVAIAAGAWFAFVPDQGDKNGPAAPNQGSQSAVGANNGATPPAERGSADEARRLAEQEAKRQAEGAEAQRLAEQEAKRQAEQAETAALKREAREEARRKEAARRRAEAEAQREADAEAQRRAAAAKRREVLQDAKLQTEKEARLKAAADARRKAESRP